MTLLMFILGILLIAGIARYNNSNKLFWILFTCFTVGFTGMKVLHDTFKDKEQNETSLNQAYPTQGLLAMDNAFVCIDNTIGYTTSKTMSNPVGQVNTPDYIESILTLSDVSGATQGLYLHMLANPPNTVEIVNDS